MALNFFRKATAIDPNFAPGHYGCALALQWDIWHYSHRPFEEVQGIPRDEALLAVSLDDKDAMAHAVLAHILMWSSEWEPAIAEARTALALNPNNAFVISMLGCVSALADIAMKRLIGYARRCAPARMIRSHGYGPYGSRPFNSPQESSIQRSTPYTRLFGYVRGWCQRMR